MSRIKRKQAKGMYDYQADPIEDNRRNTLVLRKRKLRNIHTNTKLTKDRNQCTPSNNNTITVLNSLIKRLKIAHCIRNRILLSLSPRNIHH